MGSGNCLEDLTKEKITFRLIRWTFSIELEQVKQIKKIPEKKISKPIKTKIKIHQMILRFNLQMSNNQDQNKGN